MGNPLQGNITPTEFNAYKAETATFVSAFKDVSDPDDTLSFTRALAFVNSKGGGRVRAPWRLIPYVISSTPLILKHTFRVG